MIVPTGTQVIAETPGGGPPLVFEATRSLTCLNARLASVLAGDGCVYAEPRHRSQQRGHRLRAIRTDGQRRLDVDARLRLRGAFPATDLTLFVWIAGQDSTERGVTCGLPSTAVFAPADVAWEYWSGFEWVPLITMKDDSLALTRTGEIVVRTPANALAKVTMPGEPATLFWIRARVERSQYERPPKLAALRTNTMRLLQMETVRNEVLGGSTGRRDQIFRLSNTPVLDRKSPPRDRSGLGA